MKKLFTACCLLTVAVFSSSALADKAVRDSTVDARLQGISAQLAQTNALLAKIAGESPERISDENSHPDPKVVKALESYKNECSAFGSDPRCYPEDSVIEEKGKTYKCVVSPHWQEQ